MSAAVSSASAKLPNGVLVSIGDSVGSTENMFKEMVYVLGEEAAREFMSKVRAAFLSETTPAQAARSQQPVATGNVTNSGWQNQQQQQGNGGGYRGRQQSAAPAAGNGHFCTHGEMVHKAGVSQKGNNFELWECPQGVCDTQWPPRTRR
jgi:hypothetical protein